MIGNFWLRTVLHQVARSPGSAAVAFLVLEDGTEIFTFPRMNWAILLAALAAIIGIATAIMIMVATANFDDAPTPTPSPPETCEMFCPAP
ncbi:hypothetical protein [Nocardia inohanensis]|uniref:hypothetical protein n=1 Tax=Nocardia inohanensis TaxID=209246 RepID=UPI00083776B5|nr:hypothetical protein [Nocardia inohanensis]